MIAVIFELLPRPGAAPRYFALAAELKDELAGIDGLTFVRLSGADVVRHKIVADIVAAYEQQDEQRNAQQGDQAAGRGHLDP